MSTRPSYLFAALLPCLITISGAQDEDLSFIEKTMAASVTIENITEFGDIGEATQYGSGQIITRELNGQKTNFVLTCAHVVSSTNALNELPPHLHGLEFSLKNTLTVIHRSLTKRGKASTLRVPAKIVAISFSRDLALLQIIGPAFTDADTTFAPLTSNAITIGTSVYHIGSLNGLMGEQSYGEGYISQHDRHFDDCPYPFTQTSTTVYPGSSGGGVFYRRGDHQGQYLGIVARSRGPQFSYLIPLEQIAQWTKEKRLGWIFDPHAPAKVGAKIY